MKTKSFIFFDIRGSKVIDIFFLSSDEELVETLKEIKVDLDDLGIEIYVMGVSDKPLPEDFKDLTKLSLNSSDENNLLSVREKDEFWTVPCVYMYTSGTTGTGEQHVDQPLNIPTNKTKTNTKKS